MPLPPTTTEQLKNAISDLTTTADAWIRTPIVNRIEFLETLINNYGSIMGTWVEKNLIAKDAHDDPYAAGMEWVGGPVVVLRYLQGLRRALIDIRKGGVPSFPGPIFNRDNDQIIARIYPSSLHERIITPGVSAEVWMEKGITKDDVIQSQASAYRQPRTVGSVVLVLGAGNVAGLPVLETLYKLFVEDQVVLLKMNPVNDYLGPLIEESHQILVEQGYLRIVYGGAKEGAFLSNHPDIDEIHVTGSHRTYEAIMFGPDVKVSREKREYVPLLEKRFTAELGNVGPVIVVPGPWNERELSYQAEQLAANVSDNAGFSCSRGRVIINYEGWNLRQELLNRLRGVLDNIPIRSAYYPGAIDQYDRFRDAYPNAEEFGKRKDNRLPWAFIPNLDPNQKENMCFNTESFCPVIAETPIEAKDVPSFIDRAVDFANNDLWGTLSAVIIVHPDSFKDPSVSAALNRSLANLRYGTIVMNGLGGMAWAMTSPPWGSYPGNEPHNIQSGIGFTNNTYMFAHPEKVVVRAPFTMWPKPIWFNSRARTFGKVAKRVAQFDLKPSMWKIPGILMAALRD